MIKYSEKIEAINVNDLLWKESLRNMLHVDSCAKPATMCDFNKER